MMTHTLVGSSECDIALYTFGSRSNGQGVFDIANYLALHGVRAKRFAFSDNFIIPSKVPKYVGVSAYTPVSPIALDFCRRLKLKHKKVKIIAGGRHFSSSIATYDPAWLDVADYVVTGFGEYATLHILNTQPQRQTIQGQPLSKDSLSQLPLPCANTLRSRPDTLPYIMLSRGCPFDCTFCNPLTHKVVRRNPSQCVDYLVTLYKCGIHKVFLCDDSLLLSKSWLSVFVQESQGKTLPRITCFVHAKLFNLDIANSLKRLNVDTVKVGCESGSQLILDLCCKCVTPDDMIRTSSIADKLGLRLNCLWLVGLPGETCKTLESTLSLAKQIGNCRPYCGYAVPYPGSVFFGQCNDYGTIIEDDFQNWWNRKPVFIPTQTTPELLTRYRNEINSLHLDS